MLDRAALIADFLAYAVSKVSPIAAIPLSHIAVGANIAAAGEEIQHPNDVVPMSILGAQVNVNSDYVGFVASVGAVAQITATAVGVTLGSTVAAGLTVLAAGSLILAGASNDTFRNIATDPAFWKSIKELLEDGNSQAIRRYIKNYACTDQLDPIKKKVTTASKTKSPIALDLNGDGIATTRLQDGAYFDHDGNGFAEQTGWVNSEDGILVRDLDGNGTIDTGRELFGSETLLANGQKATNGYQALAQLDTNLDGQVNQQDTAYSTLKIWKDTNGDGYSSSDELLTLAEAGVQSIATGYTAVNQTDANGNIIQQTATFTKTDGSTGVTADIWFQVDKTNTIANDWLIETDAVSALPDLQGYGNVYDLHQAMLRDSTGHLQDLVQQFSNEADPAARHALTTQLIYAWAGVENVDPAERKMGTEPDYAVPLCA
jgi:hypothetical protein